MNVGAIVQVARHRRDGYLVTVLMAAMSISGVARLAEHEPPLALAVDLAYIVRNNIYVLGIRGEGKSATHRAAALMGQRRFDAKLIHTHTFPLEQLPTALRYARDRVEDAIKVVVTMRGE